MSDIHVEQISQLGYFNSMASSYSSSVQSACLRLINLIRQNRDECNYITEKIHAEVISEMESSSEDDEDDDELNELVDQLREAENIMAQIDGLLNTLNGILSQCSSNITSLTSEASDFVSRYIAYLQQSPH